MVKIHEIAYLSGMPASDEAVISFDNISIALKRRDYLELVEAVSSKSAADLVKTQEVYDIHFRKVQKTGKLLEEIRRIFYDGGEDDDYFIRRDLKDIDEQRLTLVFEEYSQLLGFE